MSQLPLALVAGPADVVDKLRLSSHAVRYTPDRRVKWFATDSNRAIHADAVQRMGFTGKGVTVAVVDTGIDATHPDLRRRVVHNVKIESAYTTSSEAVGPALYIETDRGPVNNSDLDGGHGTFVAGIVASDGSADPATKGVAPGADLVGYSTGDGNSVSIVLLAYDHILSHPEWGVDIVNNSWGLPLWAPFDPNDPLLLGAKALHDHGITVVQAAGNSGASGEMTMSPYALAPWVIGVGASNLAGTEWSASSNGLEFDNATAVPINGVRRFTGDRLGFYHPTVLAPGENVLSTCTAAFITVTTEPCLGTQRGSGTSAAAPQVSGVLALLKQARPSLTPDQLKAVLEATSRPLADGTRFWRVGYGVVDVAAALKLVRRSDFARALAKVHHAAEQRELARREWSVPDSTHWSWRAPVAGLDPVNGDVRDVSLAVPAGTDALKVALAYPSFGNYVGENIASYSVAVLDAAGKELGRTTMSATFGTAALFLDLRGKSWAPGKFTLHVVGDLVAGDELTRYPVETTYVHQVTLVASLLRSQSATVEFRPTGTLRLGFRNDPAQATLPVLSPEGCASEQTANAIGRLLSSSPARGCVSAPFGYITTRGPTESPAFPAQFRGTPLSKQLVLGGNLTVRLHLADLGRGAVETTGRGIVHVRLVAVAPGGGTAALTDWMLSAKPLANGQNTFVVAMPTVAIPSGLRIGVELRADHTETSGGRLLFDGAYGDAGVTLTTGIMR
jgi:serine protease AprX